MSWLYNTIHQATKPKFSIINVLKQHLGGQQPGRPMDVLHASDVTKIDFCPRKWAFFDVFKKDPPNEYTSAALDVTFQMGRYAERMMVEHWGGDAVIGNWRCRYCNEQRSMVPKPDGWCDSSKRHWWEYRQIVVESTEYAIQGAPDALFNIGAPQLVLTEIKTMNPTEFDQILTPLPEHRLRTNLYMWIMENSFHPFREKVSKSEARVVYISRGYGKLNAEWNEILPFKEFVVKRNDADLAEFLHRARQLKIFRDQNIMPTGICGTALDKIAKKCSVCAECFSGKYVAGKPLP